MTRKNAMIGAALALGMLSSAFSPTAQAAMQVGITKEEMNRTYVPIRYVSEQFGYDVKWNAENQSITVQKDGSALFLQIGETKALLNDTVLHSDAGPYLESGTSYVPLRLVAEAMGMSVAWDPTGQAVEITSGSERIHLPTVTHSRWKEAQRNPIVHSTDKLTVQNKKFSINLVTVDLLNPKVSLGVGLAEGGTGSVSPLKDIARSNHASAAMNGTFFDAYSKTDVKVPYGYIVRNGEMVQKASGDNRTVLIFDQDNRVEMVSGDEFVERWKEGGIFGALQAGPRLITDGRITVDPVTEGFQDPKILTNSGARSAVGITADHKLILVTTSGATIPQLADIMLQAGAVHAMNLDGGASSGLLLNDKYITTPGREISNALLVIVK